MLILITFAAVCRFVPACSMRDCRDKIDPLAGYSSFWVFEGVRSYVTAKIEDGLPSPHAQLLLGFLIGSDSYKKFSRFNDVLLRTGTIHVAVVSGYNISVVAMFITKILGHIYSKRNLVAVLTITALYALLSGFEPPVVRAWFMAAAVIFVKFRGQRTYAILPLLYAALVMIILNPAYIYSLSFQLSLLATSGLFLFSPHIESLVKKAVNAGDLFANTISSTLSAQILVVPLLAYTFGSISVVSIVVNTLILWTVPLATLLGALYVFAGPAGVLIKLPLVFFLDIFISLTEFFSHFPYAVIDIKKFS